MIFITTFNKDIYDICGKDLLYSFIDTNNNKDHKLIVFFEDKNNQFGYCPEWLGKWIDVDGIILIDILYDNNIIKLDKDLSSKINHTDEYSSPRSVKWFRPVSAIKQAGEMTNNPFCSIDADCLFTSKVENLFFEPLLEYNISFLGRENFKLMRHGGYDRDGNYVHTKTQFATNKDTHTETGFILFNMKLQDTWEFINRNYQYWTSGDILELEYKTDCHTFDATRKELFNLKYNNLCEPMGETSPIGSRVIEESILGSFLVHHKGTIGPTLYANNLL
jgi:hypothetical protein